MRPDFLWRSKYRFSNGDVRGVDIVVKIGLQEIRIQLEIRDYYDFAGNYIG